MPNALAAESSPYLRQHAHNPVQWLPWGPEAFAHARERNVPVLVSIGYSSCHWCHVMERESFEDQRTASVMNDSFVCVKVDREERPDVDALYMEAVQGMTGRGGWPLNVFLTPEGLPFYGGTYFPPEERPGMPAFTQVLQAVAEAWEQRGEEIAAAGEQLREQLTGAARLQPSGQPLDPQSLDRAVEQIARSFDPLHGGFSGAPKFPQAPVVEFLLLRGEQAERMALYTLRSMASGGIHDQIGGGFHRYSVDANWTVPHFEKMLYDNALLARAYLHAFQLSGDERLGEVCRDTLDWALREMRGPEGGFYSALDADSDGVEGSYYVWTVAQLREALAGDAQAGAPSGEAPGADASSGIGGSDTPGGDASSGEQPLAHVSAADADAAIRWLGATQQGNFQDPHHPAPGLNVLEDRGPRPDEAVRRRIVQRLLAARARRTRPGLDDKRLASWNALMVCALADAGAALGEPRYLDGATRCAEFILTHMRRPDGGLLRTYSGRRANGNGRTDGHSPPDSEGHAKIDAFLEDHAFLLEALICLFEATCEQRWLGEARTLADRTIERFADPQRGGFYSTASHAEPLIARRKDLEDSPIPSGNSSAALGLARLAQLTGEQRFQQEAMRTLALLHEIAPRHPLAFGHLLQAIHWQLAPMRPIACELPAH